jgi:hypothetical protein
MFYCVCKSKAVSVTGCGDPQRCDTPRTSHFLGSPPQMAVRFSVLSASRNLLPQIDSCYSFLLEAE